MKKPFYNLQPTIYNQGFTIVEVMIAIGILVILFSLGLFLSMDVQRGSTFQSEQDIVTALLFKARTRALANVNESPHGLKIDEANRQYVVFEGDAYDADDDANEPFEMGPVVTFGGNPEIVFDQLTAKTSGYSLTISGEGREREFCINIEGGIEWDNEINGICE